ncbi:hypothetical protein EDD85DRAFT_957620 [Armillaria nabsnona]|nr:hypothetical protein EDD85DRAFT_957620 [Armillaria nabsnona]
MVRGRTPSPDQPKPHPSSSSSSDTMATMVVPPPSAAITKRYRPAPAKTFQCRGYGECRMVFSRSEHLARHIRKHTGERPFTCHCGKQFSRLDNLRQHAQTVHSDKQEDNERMMRDLTTLHASMAAANKSRGTRRVPPKVPDTIRPGTSTGYEGDTWHISTPTSASSDHSVAHPNSASAPSAGPGSNSFRSFRDPRNGQSFRDQPSVAGANQPAQSSNPNAIPTTLGFSSRPGTANGPTLPPLSSLIPLPPPPQSSSGGHHLFRRPSTANSSSYPPFFLRPGTAPATSTPYQQLVSPSAAALAAAESESPFSFHVPAQDGADYPSNSSLGTDDTGSRPQSRRLSVMELCNDQPAAAAAVLPPLRDAAAAEGSSENGANGASENGNGFRSPNAGFEDFSGESGYPQQQQPQQQQQQQWYTNAGTYGYYGDGDR